MSDITEPTTHRYSKMIRDSATVGTDTPERFAGFGINVGSLLIEHLLSHPFTVLRRQCQINSGARWYHLTPFTLLPVWVQVQRQQGISCIWKGVGSVFMLKGITMVTETVVSELLDLPREVNQYSSVKRLAQNLVLKSLTCALTTPFYSASLVETVESDIACDERGVLGCVREGASRVVHSFTSSTTTRTILPIYHLVPITALYGTLHYVIQSLVHYASTPAAQPPGSGDSPPPSTSSLIYHHLHTSLWASLWADTLLYPVETVMNRLHIQGTRTIIDNLDLGAEVVAVASRYEGATDCYLQVVREEGIMGLYKGFAALLLQYTTHYLLLRVIKMAADKMADVMADRRKRDDIHHRRYPQPPAHHRRIHQLQPEEY